PNAASESCDVRLSFLGPGESDRRFAAFQLLASVLEGGPLARIPLRLVDAGFVHAVQTGLVPFPDAALLEVDFTVSGPRVSGALDVVRSVAREGLERGELERARERARLRRRLARDDARGEAEWAARRVLFGLDASRGSELERIERTTAREVRELAREVVTPGR